MGQIPFLSTQPTQDEGMPSFLWRIATYLWGSFTGKAPPQVTTNKLTSWTTRQVPVAGGSGYTPLPAYPCTTVILCAGSNIVAFDVLAIGASGPFSFLGTNILTVKVVSNASEIQVRRNDLSATPTTIGAIYQA